MRVVPGVRVVFSGLRAEKADMFFGYGLVLDVDQLVILPDGILNAVLRAIALDEGVSLLVCVDDDRGNIVVTLVGAR